MSMESGIGRIVKEAYLDGRITEVGLVNSVKFKYITVADAKQLRKDKSYQWYVVEGKLTEEELQYRVERKYIDQEYADYCKAEKAAKDAGK